MPEQNERTTTHAGRHLSMVVLGHWEFATRNTKKPVVGIIAITDDGNIVLVEQFRPPIGRKIVELPAGLAGDIPGVENESILQAAKRELMEETGYAATHWTELGCGYTSPGLTDESIVLFLAQGLEKQGPGGGDASEEITIHEIPLNEIMHWLAETEGEVDLKLLAALFAAQSHLQNQGGR